MNSETAQPTLFSRVRVRYAGSDGTVERVFEAPFRIGRDAGCEVSLQNGYVSRVHVEVNYDSGQWLARDLNSSNGLYVNGQRVQSVGLGKDTTIRLGAEGPQLGMTVEVVPTRTTTPGEHTIVAKYIARYFDE